MAAFRQQMETLELTLRPSLPCSADILTAYESARDTGTDQPLMASPLSAKSFLLEFWEANFLRKGVDTVCQVTKVDDLTGRLTTE
jgi:hypothetical protein